MDRSGLKRYLAEGRSDVDRLLHSYLPGPKCDPPLIHEAMRYSLFAGGKRIRPILCLAACESVGGQRALALPFAAAIELIHSYSLVHDDLPAMDDDDYRRGKLSSHKMFGESTAILTGDALLTAAFTMLAEKGLSTTLSPKKILRVILELGSASGSTGMVGGQLNDIKAQGQDDVSLELLKRIHTHKTGVLIRASVRIGGILGGAGPKKLSLLTAFGEKIGLAFQIVDDVLDVEGEAKKLGKSVGRDESKGRCTYPALMGLSRAKKEALILVEEALSGIKFFGPEADPIRHIAAFIIDREK